MPTYAYACTACDHRFEIFQPFSEDSLTECPQCDGRLRKLFNAVGVVFKGNGFYRTDSRKGSSSMPASTSSGSSSGSSDPAGDSGASKPAATKPAPARSTSSADGSAA
ncbi:MAG TPA: FmdB family zinc ribbon protein [Pedococcus sp.]|nr:FmdB family zinc ribbon protein [Pedococcus sp.]